MGDVSKWEKYAILGLESHAMGAITNAMALYGTIIPFNSTFFVFSDYLKPAVRIASLSNIQTFLSGHMIV